MRSKSSKDRPEIDSDFFRTKCNDVNNIMYII